MQLQGELAKNGGVKVYKNAGDVMLKTWRNEGLRGLQRGLGAAVSSSFLLLLHTSTKHRDSTLIKYVLTYFSLGLFLMHVLDPFEWMPTRYVTILVLKLIFDFRPFTRILRAYQECSKQFCRL